MEELHILLSPNKEHVKVFLMCFLSEFWYGKRPMDCLGITTTLPKLNESGRCQPCWKKTCLACNSVNTTTTTEACPEISKLTVVP